MGMVIWKAGGFAVLSRKPSAYTRTFALRFATLAAALLYLTLSLPVVQTLVLARTHAPSVPGVVSTQAIAAGPMSQSGEGHACCCKHEGNVCEMGCCRADADPEPGTACFRPCAPKPTPAALAFEPGPCLLPFRVVFLAPAASVTLPRPSDPRTAFPFLPVPEKVPIG